MRAPRDRRGRAALPAACLLGAVLSASCAGIQPAPAPPPPVPVVEEQPPPDPFRDFPDAVRRRALDAEAHKDPRKALFLWKVVLAFRPHDAEAADKAGSLSDRLAAEADAHLRAGKKLYADGDHTGARREFLRAAANDPDRAETLDYLRNRLAEPDVVTYVTKEGDSLRQIAKERYGDGGKDDIIAHFNDIARDGPLRPGMRLALPVLEAVPIAEGPERASRDILNYSRETDQTEAERLYRSGMRQFQAGELGKAAADWENALRFDPAHAKARRELDRVRRMLEKGR